MNRKLSLALIAEILISGLLVMFVVGPLARSLARNLE